MSSAAGAGLRVNLLGRPRVEGQTRDYRMRSRKSWALLTYLLLSERAPTRRELTTLLFDEADDPLAALRWGLSEVRRALGDHVTIEGDPVRLRLRPEVVVDAMVVLRGESGAALQLCSLGSELLEGLTMKGAYHFQSWLVAAQRRVAVATTTILRSAALNAMQGRDFETAIDYAVRLVALTHLDEDSHALLIELYRAVGDDVAAQRAYVTCSRTLSAELGTSPSDVVRRALHPDRPRVPARKQPLAPLVTATGMSLDLVRAAVGGSIPVRAHHL
jgi:DNA-binding SARP family transcriptional activator